MSSRGWGSATSPSGRAWPDLRCMGGSASNRSQVPLALALAARLRSWPTGPPRKTDVRARPRTLGSCPDSIPLGRSRHRRRFPGRRGRGPCDWARTVSRPSGPSLMIRYRPSLHPEESRMPWQPVLWSGHLGGDRGNPTSRRARLHSGSIRSPGILINGNDPSNPSHQCG